MCVIDEWMYRNMSNDEKDEYRALDCIEPVSGPEGPGDTVIAG